MAVAKLKEQITTLSESSPTYLKSDLVKLEMGPDLSKTVTQYLQECRQVIYKQMDQRTQASRQIHLLSLMMDQLITALYQRGFEESFAKGASPLPLALFAQGGYGRAELNLFSDIDLLFIYEGQSGNSLEYITQQMLYPLWDAQMEVGYSIRTLHGCAKVMQQDIRVMSSILDARFLAGDRKVARKFFNFLESRTSSSRALKRFVKAKLRETEVRLKKFGGSVYVVEPNLKESEGGLRDWHTLSYFARLASRTSKVEDWVRSGFMSNEEADQLGRALEFFWDLRNRLHRKAGRAQDQLIFEFQEPISQELGYQSGEGKLGVEKFMQDYYRYAADLHGLRQEISRRVLKAKTPLSQVLKNIFRPAVGEYFVQVNGKLIPKNFKELERRPQTILKAFWEAQKRDLSLDEEFKSWISRHLHLVDYQLRENPEVCSLLREMFADVVGIGKTLLEMHQCRLLGVLLPEFGEILHQTQHDVYHVYTVDTHSINAVRELSKLGKGDYDQEFPIFKQALSEVKNPECLVLGVLFHDIGKGKGGRHSEIGAELARTIMTRLGYNDSTRAEVEFLVLSHLIMPHLSQRRDLEDMNLIKQFARTMENIDRLNMLFVLTWADIRAVGPDVWTPWKGSLLRELYQKTRDTLEKGEFDAQQAKVVMKQVRGKTLEIAPKRFSPKKLKAFLHSMPPRYFLANVPEQILEHFDLIHQAPDDGIHFHQSPNVRGNYNELLIFTVNTPRLFEQVTGVMAANQVNILAFEQFFNNKGEALLLLKVTDHLGKLLEEERRFRNIQKDLQAVIVGKISLKSYYQNRGQHTFLQRNLLPARPSCVEIDEDVSPYYTVIDIYTNDRVGLLYDLAKAMRKLKLYIEISKISTKVDQVADVFYVKDIFGHKINDKKKLRTIKASLLEVLSEHQKEE